MQLPQGGQPFAGEAEWRRDGRAHLHQELVVGEFFGYNLRIRN